MSHFLSSEYPQSPPESARFHVIPVPLEKSVSYGGGTAKGPAAIIEASYQLEAFDGVSCPGELGIYTASPVDCAMDVDTCLDNIKDASVPVFQAGKVPVLLGGEHTLSLAPVMALWEMRQDFGVVQIDAHADLRDSYEDSPLSHACVMRRIHELGVPLFQIGVRNLCLEERDYRDEHGIACLDARELHQWGIPENILPGNFPPNIYLSFDIDGLDSSLMPATGTPEPGGLDWWQALAVCENVARDRRILGMDLVELAPHAGMHACSYTAAKLVYSLMGIAARQ